MVWTCIRHNADNTATVDAWESLLRTTELAQQRQLILRALEAAESQGIPADLL